MSKARQFFRTTTVYFIGNVLSKLVSFFLLPLYTSKIPPTEYGSYDLILTSVNLIAPIAFFQIWDGMFRRSFDFEETEKKYDVITNAFVVSAFGLIIFFFFFVTLKYFFIFDDFFWSVIYGFMFSLNYLFNYMCRVFFKNQLLVITGLINTAITATLNILLITVFDFGVSSLYISPAIGIFIQIFIIEINIKSLKHLRRSAISKSEIIGMLKFSIPLCIATISYWLLSGLTKVIITSMLGTYENGLYAVANKFGTMITLIVSIVQYAWNEMAYLIAREKNRTKSYNVSIELMLKSVVTGTSVLLIIIKWIYPLFIDSQYGDGRLIIPATLIGVMFNSIAGFVGTLFMAENDTKEIMKSTLFSSTINVLLCLSMTKLFGLHGAVSSLAISFFILLTIRLFQTRKKYNVSVSFENMLALACVLFISVFIYYISRSLVFDIFMIIFILLAYVFFTKKYLFDILRSLKT